MSNLLKDAQFLLKEQQFQKAETLLQSILKDDSQNGSALFTLACKYDATGEEKMAVSYYNRALEQLLSQEEQKKAFIQLGSTYRTLGDYQKAKDTLEKGKEAFPEEPVFDVFYAMVLHNLNQHEEAIQLLLKKVVQTTEDEGILSFQKALVFYADHLNEVWEA